MARVWRDHDLKPWRTETVKFSTDPQLEAKVRDVVGLYLPHLSGPSWSVWMRSARSRRFPAPPQPAAAPGQPRAAHPDDVRHGTTTLFAALEVATGQVTDQCFQRHRHAEFLAFLKLVAKASPRRQLHLVLDNHGTHTHPTVKAWLAKHPRVHLPLSRPRRVG